MLQLSWFEEKHREAERKRVKSQETEYVISMKLLLPQVFGDGNQNNPQVDVVVVVVGDLEDKEEELQLNTLIFCHGGDP
jgi:hypothetical protein